MSTTEGQVGVNTNLQKQDLKNLDITNLTALSPEVISRQATINIGTIGHVAHGKSTVVKALSGVQTVRFKNELERNITIKLERIPYEKLLRISKSPELLHQLIRELNQKYKKRQREQLHDEQRFQLPMTPSSSEHHVRITSSPSSGYESAFDMHDASDLESVQSIRIRKGITTQGKSQKKTKSKVAEYVVESIVSIESHCASPLYFVKWKDYPPSTNTWEPFANVKECHHLSIFLETEMQKHETTIEEIHNSIQKEIEDNGDVLKPEDVKMEMVDGFDILEHQSDLILLTQFLLSGSRRKVERGKIRDRVKMATLLKPFIMQRMQQLRDLTLWELTINQIEKDAKVTVENNSDLEVLDASFNYIRCSFAGKGIQILEDPPIGCKCEGGCDWAALCCSKMAGGKFAYDRTGRLRIHAGEAIYECNKLCKCGPDCLNRTIQRGRKNFLGIYKTSNGCGWGLKTHKLIRKGEFVCEYVGEIISTEVANERGKQYDAIGRTYLFDLDYNTSAESVYTIDAAFHGNVSHFINHSCDPNLAVFPTWIDCLDITMPRLAFFSIKTIKAGEELSFDYISRDHEADLMYENLSEAEKVPCRCGAENCRKVLF